MNTTDHIKFEIETEFLHEICHRISAERGYDFGPDDLDLPIEEWYIEFDFLWGHPQQEVSFQRV